DIDARNKSQLRAKSRRIIRIIARHKKMPAGVGEIGVQAISLLRRCGGARRGRVELLAKLRKVFVLARPTVRRLKVGDPIGRQLETSVQGDDAVVRVRKIAARGKRPNV